MARSLIFSNGEFFIGLDKSGLVSKLYYPYVGSELHTPKTKHRVGIWVDGRISWLDSDSWTHKSRHHYQALVGHSVLVNEDIGILLEFEDFVDSEKNAWFRNIHIVNLRPEQRSVRLFLHQAFVIGNDLSADTAQYLPSDNAVLHYGGRRAFVVGGATDVGQPFDQHSVGSFGGGLDGTWRDAEDGELSGSSAECGQVDSTVRFSLTVGGLSSRRLHYWLVAGTSVRAATALQNELRKTGVAKRLEVTANAWRKWLAPSVKLAERLQPKQRQPFIQSLMMIRAYMDSHGAIISDDDHADSAFCRPREAAYAIWPLIRLGYKDEALRFFTFCRHGLTDGGYLLGRYRADGAVGSSRHPYDGDIAPLQSDESALVIFVLAQFHSLSKQAKNLKDYYASMIVPMTNFLSSFTDEHGLPRTSYNFADEHQQTSTYTTALTYAALIAAADIADEVKDQDSSVKWRAAAEDMRYSAAQHLSDGGVLKHSTTNGGPSISSLFGAFMFGLVDFDDAIITKTVNRLEEKLQNSDGLFVKSEFSTNIDWIGSLWMAQYYAEAGRSADADRIISKVLDKVGGEESESLSVWLNGELISTLLDTITRK